MFSLRTTLSKLSKSFDPSFPYAEFIRFFQYANIFPFSESVSINDPPATIPRCVLMATQSDKAKIFQDPDNHFAGGTYTNNHGGQIIHGEVTGNDPLGQGIAEYLYIAMTKQGESGLIPCVFLMVRLLPSIDIEDNVDVRIVSAMGLHGQDAEGNAVFAHVDLNKEAEILHFFAFANAVMRNILADRQLEIADISHAAANMEPFRHQQLFDYLSKHQTPNSLGAAVVEISTDHYQAARI